MMRFIKHLAFTLVMPFAIGFSIAFSVNEVGAISREEFKHLFLLWSHIAGVVICSWGSFEIVWEFAENRIRNPGVVFDALRAVLTFIIIFPISQLWLVFIVLWLAFIALIGAAGALLWFYSLILDTSESGGAND